MTQTGAVQKTQVIRIDFSNEIIPYFKEMPQNFSSLRVDFSSSRQIGSGVVTLNETAEA